MKQFLMTGLLALSFSSLAQAQTEAPVAVVSAKKEDLKLIHVADLENMIKTEKSNLYVYDANNNETRAKDGIIPGAKTLGKVSDYDVSILPADKKSNLVFYCANTMCHASHQAAQRAIKAGYTNVSVLADGIQGWKKAGKATEKFSATTNM